MGQGKGKKKKLWQRESFTTKLELKQLNAVLFCKILDRGVRSFDQQIVKFYARPFGEILFWCLLVFHAIFIASLRALASWSGISKWKWLLPSLGILKQRTPKRSHIIIAAASALDAN